MSAKKPVMVFSEMRPPVAADDGQTPLRGKHVGKLFDLAAGEYQDESGFRLTKEQICKNYTDDARMTDKNWNGRHHVTPSGFNKNNHKYYKVSPLSCPLCPKSDTLFLYLSNTSTKTSRTRTASFCTPRDSSTHTKKMK